MSDAKYENAVCIWLWLNIKIADKNPEVNPTRMVVIHLFDVV